MNRALEYARTVISTEPDLDSVIKALEKKSLDSELKESN
jgi:hypothetical protein